MKNDDRKKKRREGCVPIESFSCDWNTRGGTENARKPTRKRRKKEREEEDEEREDAYSLS